MIYSKKIKIKDDTKIFTHAKKLNKIYYLNGGAIEQISIELVSKILFDCENFRGIVLSYLYERVFHSFANTLRLHKSNVRYSHTDAAAIARGMFESAVNFIYLLDDVDNNRAASFWVYSLNEEIKINEAMKKWTSHPDPEIELISNYQYIKDYNQKISQSDPVLDSLGINLKSVSRWPRIMERCEQAGEKWLFNYDLKYKSFASWQHGDASRAFSSLNFRMNVPGQMNRNIFESIGIISWCFDIIYYFTCDLAAYIKDETLAKELDNIKKITKIKASPYLNIYTAKYQSEHQNED